MQLIKTLPLLCLMACADSADPADGGFFNGVAGLSSGTYDARINERETALASAQQRNVALNAEIASLQGQLDAAKAQLARERALLRAQGKSLPAATENKVNAALTRVPAGSTPAQQAASLRQAIADARNLSYTLSQLSS